MVQRAGEPIVGSVTMGARIVSSAGDLQARRGGCSLIRSALGEGRLPGRARYRCGDQLGSAARTGRYPTARLVILGQALYAHVVLVNVGQAKTDLSKLLARVEAGEDVEIARDGVPVARLVRVEPSASVGARFLAAHGSLAGQISIADDFEFTEDELDELLEGPA